MRYVADASAVLALLKQEDAIDDLPERLADSVISAVNLIEVADFYASTGQSRAVVAALIEALGLPVVPLDEALALDAAVMKPITREAGLSLGDRACLALAARLGVPALSGDRAWARIADAVGVNVVLVRLG